MKTTAARKKHRGGMPAFSSVTVTVTVTAEGAAQRVGREAGELGLEMLANALLAILTLSLQTLLVSEHLHLLATPPLLQNYLHCLKAGFSRNSPDYFCLTACRLFPSALCNSSLCLVLFLSLILHIPKNVHTRFGGRNRKPKLIVSTRGYISLSSKLWGK